MRAASPPRGRREAEPPSCPNGSLSQMSPRRGGAAATGSTAPHRSEANKRGERRPARLLAPGGGVGALIGAGPGTAGLCLVRRRPSSSPGSRGESRGWHFPELSRGGWGGLCAPGAHHGFNISSARPWRRVQLESRRLAATELSPKRDRGAAVWSRRAQGRSGSSREELLSAGAPACLQEWGAPRENGGCQRLQHGRILAFRLSPCQGASALRSLAAPSHVVRPEWLQLGFPGCERRARSPPRP